jgi:hypothetical protein
VRVVKTAKPMPGTSSARCNPNYTRCVPNSRTDLDCGDVGHSVRVIGRDQYGLDSDGNGSGCESYR